MTQIRPIEDLKNPNEISEICHKQNEPVFITENGYGNLVVMSMEAYECKFGPVDVNKHLAEAKTQNTQEAAFLGVDEVYNKLKDHFLIK